MVYNLCFPPLFLSVNIYFDQVQKKNTVFKYAYYFKYTKNVIKCCTFVLRMQERNYHRAGKAVAPPRPAFPEMVKKWKLKAE